MAGQANGRTWRPGRSGIEDRDHPTLINVPTTRVSLLAGAKAAKPVCVTA
jgi:hypothetical protein